MLILLKWNKVTNPVFFEFFWSTTHQWSIARDGQSWDQEQEAEIGRHVSIWGVWGYMLEMTVSDQLLIWYGIRKHQ